MKITDLVGLSSIEVKNKLIPLKEIDYRDIQIGDIMVKLQYMDDNFSAIQITEKYIDGGGAWSEEGYGEKMFKYNVYKISYGRIDENGNPIIEEILLDVSSHNYSYQGLLREVYWSYLNNPFTSPVIALNYPEGLL